MKLTRLFTARKGIVWKEIIDTVYVIMYDQHSNASAHLEKNAVMDMLRYLSDLKYSEYWNQSLIFVTFIILFCYLSNLYLQFFFLLIVFHIPLCIVRQPYKGCPLTCFLAEIMWNETLWRMHTNNVKRVY